MTDGGGLATFPALDIADNDSGWGPLGIPESFKDMPYQPFAKDARLGKVADWSGVVYSDNKLKNRYNNQFGGAQYTYYHNEDDSNFQAVAGSKDSSRNNRGYRYRMPMYRGRGRGRGGYNDGPGGHNNRRMMMPSGRPMTDREVAATNPQGRRWGPGGGQGGPGRWNQRGGWRGRGSYGPYGQQAMGRQPSVPVLDTWTVMEEMDFARLAKLTLPNIAEPTDLAQCGELEYYDKSYDKVTTKNEVALLRDERAVHRVRVSQDPIFRRLGSKNVGNVYMTDVSAAAIMCCIRSIYSWDLVVLKNENNLLFDSRGDRPSLEQRCHLVSVCETAAEPPAEEPATSINSAGQLALEATYINDNFTQQVLNSNGKKYSFPEKNPFRDEDEEDDELQSVGYRYRQFELGNNVKVVMRCEVDGVMPGTGIKKKPAQFTYIRALNEFDSKSFGSVDWRTKLDTQRGAVLASELKNNTYKLAKWTVCALMAGADIFHLGFVSRVNPKNSSQHAIVGMLPYKPEEFGQQINLNMDNAWAILRCVIDTFLKLPDGKYLLMKDPHKAQMRIYSVPRSEFEEDADSDEDDEESEGIAEEDEEEEEGGDEKEEAQQDEKKTAKTEATSAADETSGAASAKQADDKKASTGPASAKDEAAPAKTSPKAADKKQKAATQGETGAAKAAEPPKAAASISADSKPTPVLVSQTDDAGQTFKAKRKGKK